MGYHYTKHLVSEMENGIQKCLVCGEVIFDYSKGAFYPEPEETPKGFAAGVLYISTQTNPTVFVQKVNEDDQITLCKNPETCTHEKFVTNCRLLTLSDEERMRFGTDTRAVITISCQSCKQKYEFVGVEFGISPDEPTTDETGTELRLPLKLHKSPTKEDSEFKHN